MTQTTNFQLNQWSETDYVRRTDFNADNLKIDTALAALNTAVEGAGNCRMATGSYVGTGTSGADHPCSIPLPFRPRLLLLDCAVQHGSSSGPSHFILSWGMEGFTAQSTTDGWNKLTWEEGQVSWYYTGGSSSKPMRQFNESGTTYAYVMFG